MSVFRWMSPTVLMTLVLTMPAARAGGQAADPDEEVLRRAKVPTDNAGLLQFLRSRSAGTTDQREIDRLVRQLGADAFREREEASRKLAAIGLPAWSAVGRARRDPDTERARRADACWKQIERESRVSLPYFAVRLLVRRRPEGAVEALLRYLPHAKDADAVEEICFGLEALGVRPGALHPALAAALEDTAPPRRAMAACLLGRAGTPAQRAAVRKRLADADAEVRLRAAQGLLAGKDKTGLETLVRLLGEAPLELAWQAEELLHYAAGDAAPAETVGAGTPEARAKCRAAWEAWRRAHEAKLDLTRDGPEHRRPGLLLARRRVPEDKPGRELGLYGCDGHLRGRLRVPDPPAKLAWQVLALNAVENRLRCLPDGSTLILNETGLRRVGPDGKELWAGLFPTEGRYYPSARGILPNGHLLDFGRDGNGIWGVTPYSYKVFEVDVEHSDRRRPDLILVGSKNKLVQASEVTWLPTGHVLITVDDPSGKANIAQVREIDLSRPTPVRFPRGGWYDVVDWTAAAVWRWTVLAGSGATQAFRLRNGNTLVYWQRDDCWVMEVEPGGRIVWEMVADGMQVVPFLNLVRLGFGQPRPADWDWDGLAHRARQLRDPDARVRRRAIAALGRRGPAAAAAIPALIDTLASPGDQAEHDEVGVALVHIGARAVPPLLRALQDKRRLVRAGAARCFAGFEQRADTEPGKGIEFFLLHFKGPAGPIIAALIEAVKDPDAGVRREAARALQSYGAQAEAAVPVLTRALKDKDIAVCREAALALGNVGPGASTAVAALIEAAKVNDDYLRYASVRALGRLGPKAKEAVPFLIEAFQNKTYERTRRNILEALSWIGPAAQPAIPGLLAALKKKEYTECRAYILGTLVSFGPAAKAVIPHLREYFRDKEQNPRFRGYVLELLEQMEGLSKDDIPILIEALKPPKPLKRDVFQEIRVFRLAAIKALGKMGPAARAAIPVLEQVSKEQNWDDKDDMVGSGPEDAPEAIAMKRYWNDYAKELRSESRQALERIRGNK